jgi:2,4-dienoyl-CoA reductase-like NADH-dependent reductase (Old Yellow Enzyme family)
MTDNVVAANSVIFTPFTINNVRFKNRILRSSVGGRMSNYDGTLTDVWKNFEKRFADADVAAIISTTFHVNKDRVSPLQYPSIADQKFVPYLKKYIAAIKQDKPDCRYIVQIGDPGYTTYTSLFPEAQDSKSSSPGFDFGFGYNNTRTMMSHAEIERAIADFVSAAARVRDAGADGLEITATKGYLIHQFLNPGINRRKDQWGGSPDHRFRFLQTIVESIRDRIGPDFLFGVRLSAADFNYSPPILSLLRLPWPPASRERWTGNDEQQMVEYAKRLRTLKVDYLHVVAGFGFPNPRDVPGQFPFEEIKMFFNSTRHLSLKAAVRSTLVNTLPTSFGRWLLNLGWNFEQGINLDSAETFKETVGLPVIANGGFQYKDFIEGALESGRCDMVSMARALIANLDLLELFKAGQNGPEPKKLCSHCNRCVGRTVTSPLGCYDVSRFASRTEMHKEILRFNQPDPA